MENSIILMVFTRKDGDFQLAKLLVSGRVGRWIFVEHRKTQVQKIMTRPSAKMNGYGVSETLAIGGFFFNTAVKLSC